MRSIQVVLHHLMDAVIAGQKVSRTSQGIEVKKLEEDNAEERLDRPAGTKRVIVRRVSGAGPAPAAPGAPAPAPEGVPAPVEETPAPPAGGEGQ
jgi:hypothetical protein